VAARDRLMARARCRGSGRRSERGDVILRFAVSVVFGLPRPPLPERARFAVPVRFFGLRPILHVILRAKLPKFDSRLPLRRRAPGAARSPSRAVSVDASACSPTTTPLSARGMVLSDQLFDRSDGFVVGRPPRWKSRCRRGPARPVTADTMHVVVGVVGNVEVEHVAHFGNIEAAGRRHRKRPGSAIRPCGIDRAPRFRADCSMSPCRRADAEAVLLQRFRQQRHFALAIAEDDCVF